MLRYVMRVVMVTVDMMIDSRSRVRAQLESSSRGVRCRGDQEGTLERITHINIQDICIEREQIAYTMLAGSIESCRIVCLACICGRERVILFRLTSSCCAAVLCLYPL